MISKSKELSIADQCELLDVSRSGYYYKPRPETPYNETLMRRIDELHTAEPTWGSRLLRDRLRLEGHKVNRKRIQRLMALMGIQTIYPKRNLSKRNHEHKVYPYLLRGLTIDRPNQVWSADITYIRLRQGWVYMFAIIDWYSRAILAWRLSNTCDRFFCMEVVTQALQKYGAPEIFNTDQGSTFTAPEFTKLLTTAGVKISMDGKGRATDNIAIERFWRTLKQDEVYLKDYESMSDCARQIGQYIQKYNTFRPHSSCGRIPPMWCYKSSRREVVVPA